MDALEALVTGGITRRLVERRRPRLSELREVIRFRRITLRPKYRRLARALTIDDVRQVALRTTPRAVFDYVDGAADEEVTARRNRRAFQTVQFLPTSFRPVERPDTSTTVLGRNYAMPLIFGPTGYSRMMHHEGEIAVARVAEKRRIPYVLSTVGTSTIAEIKEAAPDGQNWFQLYLTKDESINQELVEAALEARVETLVLTIDCAVAGRRLKDVRNGLTIPATLTVSAFLDMCRFPYWWLNKLTTPPIEFASVKGFGGTSADIAARLFDPNLDFARLAWLRNRWPGRLLVKGIMNPADAQRAVEGGGVDGVVVSNHGGRQLDRLPPTLAVLPAVRAAVGDETAVMLDGGVTHGQDIIAALALGADAVMVGRAYLYGLMAGGEMGVDTVYNILFSQYQRGLQLMGLQSTAAITPDHVY